ncbi:signal peptidase I [Thermococcus sp. ES12]|uniref:signal peptidase I n=1 Tax=Thermococcus sp. ES12 TaxID=1638246 RepID=UPI00143011FE|nr:signal peptidase I [Thermococcus sp. ES12]NJE76765.1 signal peptidase I [Thermococcus sp. ES12]
MRVKYLVLLILVVPAIVLLPSLGRLDLLVVLSGSMSPLFNPGDMVVIEKIEPSAVTVGDVIAFHPPNAKDEKTLVTHRVVEVIHNGSRTYFQTKGDNNEDRDPYLVPLENVVGKAVFSLPYLGYLTRHNPNRTVKFLTYVFLIVLPGLIVLYSELVYLRNYSPRIERMEEKLKRWRSRAVEEILPGRMAAIFVISLVALTLLFHPSIERTPSGVINSGGLPVLLLRDDVPDYVYLPPGETYDGNYEIAVSSVLPVMWLVRAYEVNPFILKSLNVIISLLLTLVTFPLWVREFPDIKSRVRRRHHGTLGV